MDGILLVDKPEGWTSHDVVAKVRGMLRKAESQKLKAQSQKKLLATSPKVKVGHTGTLDPAATGLLILVIGSYTKRAGDFSQLDKVYEAELTLGMTSTTGDKEGELTKTNAERPEKAAVESILARFEGEILQKPHKYSAVKIDGQRAYKAARAGKTVEIEPRKVKIYDITDVKYEYPKLTFTCKVSSGTYIRSLSEDIGQTLGTGAYLSALRRTKVGDFSVADALQTEMLGLANISNHLAN
jgi:tRNA pseudouridine55 synthase